MNGDQQNPTNPNPIEAPAPPAAPTPGGAGQKPVIADKLRSANSILVTVSADPSIDQLAACIALTLILEKFKKNASTTAVFSGKVPSALEFLKPGEVIETSTDSLRDFIIAIDKSKADKLRYKVEDNVVKIFITPYKTVITEKDLQYNAGDFNVDVIVALGVQHQQDLDTAITAHGRIFHDASVVCINNAPGGDFGIANWEDFEASSLSELITQLVPDLGPDLLDADIATALLTGIVAETNHFSNSKTHPGTMTVSSTLLQAGADQQLVNQQLQSILGTEVQLEAGSEIKPTMSIEELEKLNPHEAEELVLGKDGSISPTGEATSKPDETATPEPISVVTPDAVVQREIKLEEAPKPEEPAPEVVAPAPAINPADDPEQAEAARKAITDALKNAAAESEVIQPEQVTPPETPVFQPGPGVPAPASPPVSVVPPIGSEPAPLSSSPADQPFTMPMPPAGAFAQAPPINMSPTSPAPDTGATPPPLPPPLPPPPAPPMQ